jgi:tRNA(Ile)-lysidine synthase
VPQDPFLRALEKTLSEWPSSAGYAVSFSGGADSTLLLTALARLGLGSRLRALHVDHGLHPDSARWAQHCEAAARALGLQYAGVRVSVAGDSPLGLEGAARAARYGALRELLHPAETLVTAHHADDQLETVLLRMLRGTGVRGLRGIVAHATFGRGYLARPLLDFTRRQLRAQAQGWQLSWIEDPANLDAAHDRNYLRLRVLPALAARWPAAAQVAQRLARQLAEAEELLEERAALDAGGLARADRVPCALLLELAPSRRHNLVRYLLRQLGLPTPNASHLQELDTILQAARHDAQPRVAWPGGEARVYRGWLHLFAPLPPRCVTSPDARLVRGADWVGPEGRVGVLPTDGAGFPEAWLDEGLTVRLRVGGERFRPAGRAADCALKRWLHEAGIVPWMRPRLPLIFRGAQLVAVADLALDQSAACAAGERRVRVSWTDHPAIR